jgi:hypothetical protein
VYGYRDTLSPEVARQRFRLEQAVRHAHHGLVTSFHHTVLLLRIGGGEMAFHASLDAIRSNSMEVNSTPQSVRRFFSFLLVGLEILDL